ncbi:MAG: DUF883 domain-containing protein [Paracoccus sp. (in: a-proteobacteria)]|nr:DUF883 domain-containing protein [Paracoccus sp. (in: a-proteobacteria)]
MAHSTSADDVKRDANAAAQEAKRDLTEGARKIEKDVRETASNLAENSGVDRLAQRGAEIANDAVEAGRQYADRARETGQEYADRARLEAERLYGAGQQKAHEAAIYAEDRYDEVSEMVRRNPAQSLGIAAGVGFLVGLLIARR